MAELDVSYKDFLAGVERAMSDLEREGERRLEGTARYVLARAKGRVKVRTGALRDSLTVTKTGAGTFAIASDQGYASIQEFSPKYGKPFLRPSLAEAPGHFERAR